MKGMQHIPEPPSIGLKEHTNFRQKALGGLSGPSTTKRGGKHAENKNTLLKMVYLEKPNSNIFPIHNKSMVEGTKFSALNMNWNIRKQGVGHQTSTGKHIDSPGLYSSLNQSYVHRKRKLLISNKNNNTNPPESTRQQSAKATNNGHTESNIFRGQIPLPPPPMTSSNPKQGNALLSNKGGVNYSFTSGIDSGTLSTAERLQERISASPQSKYTAKNAQFTKLQNAKSMGPIGSHHSKEKFPHFQKVKLAGGGKSIGVSTSSRIPLNSSYSDAQYFSSIGGNKRPPPRGTLDRSFVGKENAHSTSAIQSKKKAVGVVIDDFQVLKSKDLFDKGQEAYKLKDYPNAIKNYSLSYQCDPRNLESLLYRGLAYFDCSNPERAILVPIYIYVYRTLKR